MTNFLDLRCPNCSGTDQIDIEATVWLRVTDEGTVADASDGHHDYTPRSLTVCGACSYSARLFAFEPAGGVP